MYIHIYTYIHTYIYVIYIHTYIHTYVNTHTHTHIHTYTYTITHKHNIHILYHTRTLLQLLAFLTSLTLPKLNLNKTKLN
jgi:hypothetical protein